MPNTDMPMTVSVDFPISTSEHFSTWSSTSSARYFLDIFAGASCPVSVALNSLNGDRLEPIDLIHGHDLLDDQIFESLLHLCSSRKIGAALAAPYCSKHSRATLRRPGPAPVRTPEFIDGIPGNTWEQQLAVQESATIHHGSRLLLSAVDTHCGLILLEKPSSSMTWDDPLMYEWVHIVAPYVAQASACKFGKDWAKTWMFVSNRPDVFAVAQG